MLPKPESPTLQQKWLYILPVIEKEYHRWNGDALTGTETIGI